MRSGAGRQRLVILLTAALLILALGLVTDSYCQQQKAPSARVEVTQHKNGTATLTFTFLQVPKDFEVSSIVLQLAQTKPTSAILGNPSGQVRPAFYTLRIGSNDLKGSDPTITAQVRMYHDPAEPYALAKICLWNAIPNSRIEIEARPSYRNAAGENIVIATEPEKVPFALENRLTVRPALLTEREAQDEDCETRNAKAFP